MKTPRPFQTLKLPLEAKTLSRPKREPNKHNKPMKCQGITDSGGVYLQLEINMIMIQHLKDNESSLVSLQTGMKTRKMMFSSLRTSINT